MAFIIFDRPNDRQITVNANLVTDANELAGATPKTRLRFGNEHSVTVVGTLEEVTERLEGGR